MVLGFSIKIKGKPTRFVDKISACLYKRKVYNSFDEYCAYMNRLWEIYPEEKTSINLEPVAPKIHTIREDKHDRWKARMDIHFVVGNRTKKRCQFAPIIQCVSTQKVEIKKWSKNEFKGDSVFLEEQRDFDYTVRVDGKLLYSSTITTLAINDGFDNVDDFFEWFKEDWTGKIIHWTDKTY